MKTPITLRAVPFAIQLDEIVETGGTQQVPSRVQLMRTATLFDKRYGEVKITKEMFENMVKKFDENVRGIDLMIDYGHKTEDESAGWIKSLDVVEVQLDEGEGEEPGLAHELWAIVEWTPDGEQKLSEKKFRYLSADFDPNYKDNEKPNVSHGPVLLGAGLTNRPVIKRMNPIQLSETELNKENKSMKFTEEEAQKLQDDNAVMSDKLSKVDAFMKDMGVGSIEELMKMISDLRSENETMLSEKKTSEKKEQLDGLMKDGKITAAQHEKAMTLSEDAFNGFVEVAKMNEKVVKLDEDGDETVIVGNGDDEGEGDAQDQVFKLAEEKMSKDKSLSMTSAISQTLSENTELAKKYREEVDQD